MPLIDLNGLGYFKGKENAMIAGTYSASKTYAVGDYCYYSGTLYRCTTAITTAEAWTSGHWTAAKLAEDLTSQSEKITEITGNTALTFEDGRKPVYDNGTTDYVDEVVVDADYVCLAVPCVQGDVFTIRAYGGATTKAAYGWANSEKKGISRFGTNSLINGAITAPENAAYLIVNNRLSQNTNYYAYKGYLVKNYLTDLNDNVNKTMMLRSASLITNIDTVDVNKTGFYQWSANATHPLNEPTFTVGKAFQLINFICGGNSNDRSLQIITIMSSETGNSRMYYRYKATSGWNDWIEIITSNNPIHYWCYGKNINWIGDSIVSGSDFDEVVCSALGMSEEDYGISGSTIALKSDGTDERDAVVARYSEMTNDADIIAVSAGTNDWMYAWSDIGTIESTTNTTFYGALKNLCEGLINKYPDKVIFFTTPIKRAQAFANGDGGTYTADGVDTTPFSKNKYGKTLGDYANIIKEVCGYYSIPVLDMYNESGMNPSNATQQALLFTDKTHPNSTGMAFMARRVAGWITQLSYNIALS